jgi:hypothetical protein
LEEISSWQVILRSKERERIYIWWDPLLYFNLVFGKSTKLVVAFKEMASLYAVPYNSTGMTGRDSLTENLNIYFEVAIPFIIIRGLH